MLVVSGSKICAPRSMPGHLVRLGYYQTALHPLRLLLQRILNRHQNAQRVSSTELLRALLSQTSALLNISVSHLISTYSLRTDSRVDQPGCDRMTDPPLGFTRLLTQLWAGRAACKQAMTGHCPNTGRRSSKQMRAAHRNPSCMQAPAMEAHTKEKPA